MQNIFTQTRSKVLLKEAALMGFVALAVAFLGKITVPLPGTFIPMALRPQLVILLLIFGMVMIS